MLGRSIRAFQRVLSSAESLPPQRAVILFAHDQAVMRVVKEGMRRTYREPVLVGLKPNIQAAAREVKLDLKGIGIESSILSIDRKGQISAWIR